MASGPGAEEPGGPQYIGLQRAGHDRATDHTKFDMDMEELEFSYNVNKNVKWHNHFGKWLVSKKWNIQLPYVIHPFNP